ncbi:Hypothetical predicted protein [Octopus vulgaris]|uniref:Uncharacterized protein n=1 Tax=Octopus vulgaris TaxID=6645 RepID=A0AA36C2I7_OCTVU|nr:Hypothetical predicted protein [Octopus vulgaris]
MGEARRESISLVNTNIQNELHAPCAELGTEDREDPKRLEEGSFGEAAEEWGFYHKVKMERNYLAFHSKQSPYKNHPGAIERYH